MSKQAKKAAARAAKAAAKQAVVIGSVAAKSEVFKGDSVILPALAEALKEDKSGTQLSTPVKLEPSPLVKTQAETTGKPLPEYIPGQNPAEMQKPLTKMTPSELQQSLKSKGIVATKEALPFVASSKPEETALINELKAKTPGEKALEGKAGFTPAELKAAQGTAKIEPTVQPVKVAPTTAPKVIAHGIAVGKKTLTAAMQNLLALWESAKVFGSLKPDPADTYKMSFKETKIMESSINHLEKYIVGLAENLSPEAWKHWTAHTKIQHNHMLSQIERGKAYVKEHGTLTM